MGASRTPAEGVSMLPGNINLSGSYSVTLISGTFLS
jgi:hypothetical protein